MTQTTIPTYAGHAFSATIDRAAGEIRTSVDSRPETFATWRLSSFEAAVTGSDYHAGPTSLHAYARTLRVLDELERAVWRA